MNKESNLVFFERISSTKKIPESFIYNYHTEVTGYINFLESKLVDNEIIYFLLNSNQEIIKYTISDFLKSKLTINFNQYKSWIYNLFESGLTKKRIQNIITLHLQRIQAIKDNEVWNPEIKTTILNIESFLNYICDLEDLKYNNKTTSLSAGRRKIVTDDSLASMVIPFIEKSKKTNDISNEYYHCIHKTGRWEGKPNYSELRRLVFIKHPSLSEKFNSNEGLEKAIKRALSSI